MYGAEKITASTERQFQVHLIRSRQAANKWSEADQVRPIEQLQCKIHYMTPVNGKHFNELFQQPK